MQERSLRSDYFMQERSLRSDYFMQERSLRSDHFSTTSTCSIETKEPSPCA